MEDRSGGLALCTIDELEQIDNAIYEIKVHEIRPALAR